MKSAWLVLCFLVCVNSSALHRRGPPNEDVKEPVVKKASKSTDVDEAQAWLDQYNAEAQDILYEYWEVAWQYNTNITDHNAQAAVDASLVVAQFDQEKAVDANEKFDWQNIDDELIVREFSKITDIGFAALEDQAEVEEISQLIAKMSTEYSTGKVCKFGVTCEEGDDTHRVPLDPDITRTLAESRNYYELQHYWKEWHDVVGAPMRDDYIRYVELSNKAALANGYEDGGDYWRRMYESDTFRKDVEDLMIAVMPLYEKLHAYARHKLGEWYGTDKVPLGAPIPAHLFGNMWAQQWDGIYDMLIPYPGAQAIDVTQAMVDQGYDALKIFEVSEEFFTSLGLIEMPDKFWNDSMIVKPDDGREVVCHASAWDFYNQVDFRIKQCTDITMGWLSTTHHEMGHVEYFLQYMEQPVKFRDGANPGFHEAIGDLMSLSVETPEHLHKIGLLEEVEDNEEADLNFLMKMALDKIAFLPFGYLIDLWRWDVFSGTTPPEQLNQKWEEVRCKWQGLQSPVTRTEEHFDPGAKFHVPNDVPYIRYFVSFIIQFQFHKALCAVAGHTGPLHRCDIYQSTDAGSKLSDALVLGSSKPWPEAMDMLTGQGNMLASDLMEYFQPLINWLDEENARNGVEPGWWCTKDEEVQSWLDDYNTEAEQVIYKSVVASWTYNTNITDYNAQQQIAASVEASEFHNKKGTEAQLIDMDSIEDELIKRELKKIQAIGFAALPENEVEEINEIISNMTTIYSTGKVCKYQSNCGEDDWLPLDPDITNILASSTNYAELLYYWTGWHDNVGAPMKDSYVEYVRLSNKAAILNGYPDQGSYWRRDYESDTLVNDVAVLWDQLKPLYEKMHAYTRFRLQERYGEEFVNQKGPIAAHILGYMNSELWSALYELVEPFPGYQSVDVTDEMVAQGYDAMRIFEVSEEFFNSLGLIEMPQEFWDHSMIEKPTDGREVVCHASAWDFYNRKDFRIKQCTDINMKWLSTTHHEMGHVEYFLQYKDQPVRFRDGANPGFHEAIGDLMSLSVETPAHLHEIGLLLELEDSPEADTNFLMLVALSKLAFLPFGYLMDEYRWNIFEGKYSPSEYNEKWWETKCRIQGVQAAVPRAEEKFDAGGKFHTAADYPYIRYFISYIIQFQFHKALCEEAGHEGPLYKCDIYNSKEAGQKLADALELGSSKPWPEVMEIITGQPNMDAEPLVEYFGPLIEWLDEQIAKHNIHVGWDCSLPTTTEIPDSGISNCASIVVMVIAVLAALFR